MGKGGSKQEQRKPEKIGHEQSKNKTVTGRCKKEDRNDLKTERSMEHGEIKRESDKEHAREKLQFF